MVLTHDLIHFFNTRLVTDSTMTTTATCLKVAVSDTLSTTALSNVATCVGRKRRSIDDAPSHEVNLGDIAPSAAAGNSDGEADLQAAGVNAAASSLSRRQRHFFQPIRDLIQ